MLFFTSAPLRASRVRLLACTACLSLVIGCSSAASENDSTDGTPSPVALPASLAAGSAQWAASSAAAGSNYFYWRVRPAGMQPIHTVTGVQVQNGRVIARYVVRSRHSGGKLVNVETLRESSPGAIRTRPGYPAHPMPRLIKNCGALLGVSGSRPRVSMDTDHFGLAFDERGVLNACYRVPRGCMDDCGTSFSVDGLVFRVLSAAEIDSFLKTGRGPTE